MSSSEISSSQPQVPVQLPSSDTVVTKGGKTTDALMNKATTTVTSTSSPRPETTKELTKENIKKLKEDLDNIKPTGWQILGAVVTGFLLGALSVALTGAAFALGVLFAIPSFGLSMTLPIYVGVGTFGFTTSCCSAILSTEKAKMEAIKQLAGGQVKTFGEVCRALQEKETEGVSQLQEEMQKLDADLTKKLTDESNSEAVIDQKRTLSLAMQDLNTAIHNIEVIKTISPRGKQRKITLLT